MNHQMVHKLPDEELLSVAQLATMPGQRVPDNLATEILRRELGGAFRDLLQREQDVPNH